jgi:hypothetical protein
MEGVILGRVGGISGCKGSMGVAEVKPSSCGPLHALHTPRKMAARCMET